MSTNRNDNIYTTVSIQDIYLGNPLTGRSYKLPQNDGTSGQFMITDGKGNVNFGSKALSYFIADATGASVTTNDHIRFNSPLYVVGSNITVDTASPYTTVLNTPSLGRITLLPGTYKVDASVLEIGTSFNNGVVQAAIRNANTGTYYNPTGSIAAGSDRYFLHDKTVITVASTTRIEFTFVFASGLSTYGKAIIEIEQLV